MGVPLKLNYQPRLGDRDPAAPLHVCAWQPRESAKQRTLNDKAAAPKGVEAAQKAAKPSTRPRRLGSTRSSSSTSGRTPSER